MIHLAISSQKNPLVIINKPNLHKHHKRPIITCSQHHKNSRNFIEKQSQQPTFMVDTHKNFVVRENKKKKEEEKSVLIEKEENKKKKGSSSSTNQIGGKQMLILCGFGYWLQGFRCFPWLALNFHMASNLNLDPSILQLVQYSANLPMVAKPLYGILSDVIYIGGAHRIPYIITGVFLQIFAWNYLAFVPAAREVLTVLVAAVLLSNLGASITEVAKDALVAEYGKKHKIGGLQSYAFMALAAGGILGNLIGGYFLLKLPPRIMFMIFSALLSVQLAISFSDKSEEGACTVKFKDEIAAMACIKMLNGRYFAQQRIEAKIFDGTKYAKSQRAVTEEDDKAEEERLENFAKWLESQEDK